MNSDRCPVFYVYLIELVPKAAVVVMTSAASITLRSHAVQLLVPINDQM